MKIFIYISGISGLLLLTLSIVGIYMEFPLNDIFLLTGIILTVVIFIPFYSIDRYFRKRKIKRIIQAFKDHEIKEEQITDRKVETKGLGMSDSVFRTRKAALTSSGENVHAENAAREPRKVLIKN